MASTVANEHKELAIVPGNMWMAMVIKVYIDITDSYCLLLAETFLVRQKWVN